MQFHMHSLGSLWLSLIFCTTCLATIFDGPQLEFGGKKYQPTHYNETGGYYLYSNIRYAAPPIGDLRWSKPQPPKSTDPDAETKEAVTCTQVTPSWWNITGFPGGFVAGVEDCLFLDIYVPRNQTKFGKTPVMLWIHGGGFITGSKTTSGDPAGLLWAADEPVIYVAINYRLGGLGFLDSQEVRSDGVPNAGLHDQRAALDWTQDHIAAFGGSPRDVTVFGESAGASSVMYHITSYGGKTCPPFRRAILQSNAFFPGRGHANSEERFAAFAKASGCSDLKCLRNATSEAVINANTDLMINSTENYTPQIDGDFVPDFPGWLLNTGKFCSDIEIMIGNNDDEGGWFLNNPALHAIAYSNDTSTANLEGSFATMDSPLTNDVTKKLLELYPAPSNSTPYTNMIGREELFQTELNFLSSSRAIAKAWNNHVYAYRFSVGYTIHADDVPYTYYDGASDDVKNATAAIALQKYLTRFAVSGDPNRKPVDKDTLPEFRRMDTGSRKSVLSIGQRDFTYITDESFANERTDYLASGKWM